jgi:two-component system alkaline phosphatase synthesis response regulator PhoP
MQVARGSILAVDDEGDVLELVRYNFNKEGFKVETATTGEEALKKAKANLPNVILLDRMLPGIDGIEVCRMLKADSKTSSIPIIMLTAKGEESDVVSGLEVGADDYVTKPFSPRELIARVKAILRRHKEQPLAEIKRGQIVIDSVKHKVLVKGQEVELTFTEFRLLENLAKRPGAVFSRNQLLDALGTDESMVYDRTVDAHVKSLRRKLGRAKDYIETVRGVGYRFREV